MEQIAFRLHCQTQDHTFYIKSINHESKGKIRNNRRESETFDIRKGVKKITALVYNWTMLWTFIAYRRKTWVPLGRHWSLSHKTEVPLKTDRQDKKKQCYECENTGKSGSIYFEGHGRKNADDMF